MEKPADWEESFLRIWKFREETIYPALFGTLHSGLYPLTSEIFRAGFGQEEFDPRWLFCGVLVSPPSDKRSSWLYVTSGMSNAWDDETFDCEGESGLGCEFVFETTEQADWAIRCVQNIMAFQILLSSGRFGDKPPLLPYDRIPLRGPIKPATDSPLHFLMVCPPENYPESLTQESGTSVLLPLVGITDQEAAYARTEGGDKLLSRLKRAHAFPVTDPNRQSVVLGESL